MRNSSVYRRPARIVAKKLWIGTAVVVGSVTVTPPTATLTITTYAPTVLTPRVVTPPTLALTISTFAPTVLTPRVVIPPTLALTISTFAPTVSTPRVVTPPTLALVITTYAPTVMVTTTPTTITGGGITILHRPRVELLLPRTLEPEALPALATFWSIVTIEWILAVEGELSGRSWANATIMIDGKPWDFTLGPQAVRARGVTRGLADHRVVIHETDEEEAVLIGI